MLDHEHCPSLKSVLACELLREWKRTDRWWGGFLGKILLAADLDISLIGP